ncbi:MAG: tetratricopeptide repeat protein [Planctomycetota bacterium]|jgi:tetratricopeptide (TPR) repeat protein|nr:tetratricopeptide repeat protein [Planctomycetota bacterium]
MKTVHRFALAVILLFAAGFASAGELRDGIYISGREYVVTISPADEESRNAENADLYSRRGPDAAWTNLGPSEKLTLPDGTVQFLKLVNVDADGVYHYTSRPVVGGEVSLPPTPESPAQAVVIVDTIPPKAEITRPAEPARGTAGESLEIAWVAIDENLEEYPATLQWSADGGETWRRLADNLLPAGEMIWRPPTGLKGQAALRLAAVDKAGNAGTAVRLVEIEPAVAVMDAPVVPETPERVVPKRPEKPDRAKEPDGPKLDKNRSWLYYLMAVNLMRQNKPREALRYYWLSVREDPDFINAWADIGLAYIDVGAYKTARDVVGKTRAKAPDRVDLMHLMGETYHAEAMELLARARTTEDRIEAKQLIDNAVAWYGRALEEASDEWRLAEQAPSFYRLGEICYYVNFDRDGARAYWRKILDLHTPEPNPDLKMWATPPEWEKANLRYQRYTYMRVNLDAWQNWARGYLEQLDARERAGIVDLMPAQRVGAASRAAVGGPDVMLPPGADRSLFSLPEDFPTSRTDMPTATGTASGGAMRRDNPAAAGYSFYAPKERPPSNPPARGSRSSGSRPSMFSGLPERPAPEPVDPYDFPGRGRGVAPWSGGLPYGDKPVENW